MDAHVEKVKDISVLSAYNLCYLSEVIINFKCGIKLNNDYRGLILWFTDNPLSLKGDKLKTSFSTITPPPNIDREFYVMYIKDFMTEEMDGIEFNTYQRDEWITAPKMYRNANYLTMNMINNGAGCWLYNIDTKDVINSCDTIFDVLNFFKDYKIDIYKINKK